MGLCQTPGLVTQDMEPELNQGPDFHLILSVPRGKG